VVLSFSVSNGTVEINTSCFHGGCGVSFRGRFPAFVPRVGAFFVGAGVTNSMLRSPNHLPVVEEGECFAAAHKDIELASGCRWVGLDGDLEAEVGDGGDDDAPAVSAVAWLGCAGDVLLGEDALADEVLADVVLHAATAIA